MVIHAKRKPGEERNIHGVRTEGLLVDDLLSPLLRKRSNKIEEVLKSEKSPSKGMETFGKQYLNEKRLMGWWNEKLGRTSDAEGRI